MATDLASPSSSVRRAQGVALGGVAELLFGVKAEGEQLEDIAKPLTAEDAEQDRPGGRRRDRA
jgi:hypothetical protein